MPHSNLTSVDFPLPFSPTSASVLPAGMNKDTSWRTAWAEPG
jgi:hypothetical protein